MSVLPARVLYARPSEAIPVALWTADDGTGDPWLNQPYRWSVTLHVSSQSHSSHLTPVPFSYCGTDVRVGDWFSDVDTGSAVKIVSISAQDANHVSCIVEDLDRFNTFNDPTQNGLGFSAGAGFVFTLGEDGLPILGPMTAMSGGLSQNVAWQMDQTSRFRYRNYTRDHYPVLQPGHGLAIGDLIVLTGAGYVKASAGALVSNVVGSVAGIGTPGADWFDYRPVGRVVRDLAPPLPGQPGDLVYLSDAGGLTTTKPRSFAQPVYIRLEVATSGIVLDRGIDGVGSQGYSSQSHVVNTLLDRDAIIDPNDGDQALVRDIGDGSWAHFIFEGSDGWTLLGTREGVTGDARMLQIALNHQSAPTGELGVITAGGQIDSITVQVLTAFDGTVSLSVGSDQDAQHFMGVDGNDLGSVGIYRADAPTDLISAQDVSIRYFISFSNTTTGTAIVTMTYY